ncbi:MAG TPA: tryptophan halogenase family protein [Allosphingosinicella sp.]
MTRSVLIVGGGTAGWMTASYLIKAFPDLKVSVVESERIGTIGVGEATFSTIKVFLDFLELKESDWMSDCNATYKLAVKFVDWQDGPGHFYHPFQRYETVEGFNLGEWWLRVRPEQNFDEACFTIPALCEAKSSPRFLDGRVFDERVRDFFDDDKGARVLTEHRAQYPYAYHFDALLFAKFLEGYATARGVHHLTDDVVDVRLGEDGAIAGIETRNHGELQADLYIDCSGFRGLLLNQALGEPFIPFGDYLLNDAAIGLQVPSDIERDGIDPYTTAHALTCGWAWTTPLYSRNGKGYVYSTRFITPEAAEEELRAYIGPGAEGCRANHIKMRIGRARNSWVKNCVAVGLSSGFVEPLESAGIFFIQHNIEELVAHFPGAEIDERAVRNFNRIVGNCIDGVRDFLVLHYRAAGRTDTPFWRAVREAPAPPSLTERLELWKSRLPNAKSIEPNYHGFEAYSYSVIILGMGYGAREPHPALARRDVDQAKQVFGQVREQARDLVSRLPSQREYLAQMRALERRAEPAAAAMSVLGAA